MTQSIHQPHTTRRPHTTTHQTHHTTKEVSSVSGDVGKRCLVVVTNPPVYLAEGLIKSPIFQIVTLQASSLQDKCRVVFFPFLHRWLRRTVPRAFGPPVTTSHSKHAGSLSEYKTCLEVHSYSQKCVLSVFSALGARTCSQSVIYARRVARREKLSQNRTKVLAVSEHRHSRVTLGAVSDCGTTILSQGCCLSKRGKHAVQH